ncbi:MAG: DUF3795 domain-containing protein [Promethearchaeota archaeon]
MSFKLDDVQEADRGLLAPCGILCLGCDSFIGEGFDAAEKLKEIWEGSNIMDVGPMLGLNAKGIKETFKSLDAFIKATKKQGKCPGCYMEGGPSKICGIANCVKSKGYWTCAECEDYDPDSEKPCPLEKEVPMPLGNPSQMMKMICTRYNKDTNNNLKKCREIGYAAFIKEAKKKVANGWRTWQVISDELVFTNSMKE